jgi:hypothetical protein
VYNLLGALFFTKTTISGNMASLGGGLYNAGSGATATLSDSTILKGNTAINGGGVYNFDFGESIFSEVTITENMASSNGGGLFNYNQGVFTFTNATISANEAITNGGGVCNEDSGASSFTNTTISGNTATYGAGVYNVNSSLTLMFNETIMSGNAASFGGGIYNSSSSTFSNMVIAGNIADNGGGVYNSGTTTFKNATIAGNTAIYFGGGLFNSGNSNYTNTIVAKNNANNGSDISSSLTIGDNGNNLIGDTTGSNGWILTTLKGGQGVLLDPLFIEDVPPARPSIGGELELQPCSPAINAGKDTLGLYIGLADVIGLSRVFEDKIDIGAYENQSSFFSLSCRDTTLYLDATGTLSLDTSMVIGLLLSACPLDTVYFIDAVLDCNDTDTPALVEIVAVNERGDTLRCFPNVTVRDTIIPTINCRDTTVYLNASGMAMIDSSYLIGSISEACGIETASLSKYTFNCLNAGANAVTLMVTDVNDNSQACIGIVTVLDTIKPAIVCRDTTVYLNASGMVMIDSSYLIGSIIEACGIKTARLSKYNFNCINAGANAVTLTVTDLNENSQACIGLVTVLDTIKPAIVCRDTTVYLDASGMAMIDSSYLIGSIIEGCGIKTARLSKYNFNCLNAGANAVTLTVTDLNENSQACIGIVTVLDTIKPVVVCRDTTVYLNTIGSVTIDSSYIISSVNEACGIITASLSKTNFSCTNIGLNPVSLTVMDKGGNVHTCSAIVTVSDTIKPVKPTLPDILGECSATAEVPITIDNCDVSIIGSTTDSLTYTEQGIHVITWTFDDGNGNVITALQNVIINDVSMPTIDLIGDTSIVLECGTTSYVDAGAHASDNCDSVRIEITNPVNVNLPGEYTVSIKAIDASGNESVPITRLVIVPSTDICNTCKDEIIITAAELANDPHASSYSAIKSIVIDGIITSQNVEKITLKAAESIELKPEFITEKGAELDIIMEACQNTGALTVSQYFQIKNYIESKKK